MPGWDELVRELRELDGLIDSALERRARLVKAVRMRDRHRQEQTSIIEPNNEGDRQ